MPKTQSPVLAALSFYGETPIAGPQSNGQIQQFLAAAGLPADSADEVPWCSAFLVYIFQQCGKPVAANAAAISWLNVGKETTDPVMGDIVVFAWPPEAITHHHVGIFIREIANDVYVLAGNQDNTVDIALWKKADVISYRRV